MNDSDSRIIGRLRALEQAQERNLALEYSRTIGEVYAEYLSLPGLVGFWPMSSVQRSTGNAYDLSGQGRTLSYNGNPTYNIYNSLIPYIDMDGTGDFLSRADETDLDILGSETIYAAAVRGLTIGGWFWSDEAPAATIIQLIGKYNDNGVNQRSYILYNSGASLNFTISSDGTAITNIASSISYTTGVWRFLVGRYTPSSELAVFANGIRDVNVGVIPASIFNSTSVFDIGRYQTGPQYLDGRAALCFLCANTLSDLRLQRLFNVTRPYFGV